MTRSWRQLSALLVAAILVGACSSGDSGSSTDSESTDVSTITWLPCGDIECGRLSIQVDSEAPDLGAVSVALYRRTSSRSSKAPMLFLIADRRFGYTPRVLAEESELHFGSGIDGYTIVSVAARGMIDSPMPAGAETRIATLDVVEDLEAVREALNVDDVYAMGWGSGATAIATWKMQYPESIKAAVIDAPMDPAAPIGPQVVVQLESSRLEAVTAVKWCASHLSCVLNAEVADEIGRFKLKMLTGTVPPTVTKEVIARAASNALAINRPTDIFSAISDAMDGDASRFLELAGPELTVSNAYAPCSDVSLKTASRLASRAASMHAEKTRQFPVGIEPTIYSLCAQLPESPRPLGEVQFFKEAQEDKVFVTIARGDPIVPPAPARKMAASMKWTYKSVYANRHLVVGFDRAITEAAMEFLAS